jgi:polysaccharide export outer membrane protein
MKLSHSPSRLSGPFGKNQTTGPDAVQYRWELMMGHVWRVLVMLLACNSLLRAEEIVASGYRLQPGDVLQVVVWKETDLQSEVLIRPDGGISFPLAGDIQAAGLTTAQLRTELESRVRKLIPDAVVTVSVKAPNGNRVFVIGKVNKPGDFPLLRPTDVMQALSLAGGATPFASTDRIRILHRDGSHQTSIRFRYSDVARGRNLDQNILLQSGDTVIVP